VVDEESLANLSPGVNLDAGKESADISYQPSRALKTSLVQAVGYPMVLTGMKTGIGEEYYQATGGGWIPLQGSSNISFYTGNKRH
jgi:hypothetical protein